VSAPPDALDERDLVIAVDGGAIVGTLASPSRPRGLVIFAHGSGSSRRSPRNRFVASAMHREGFATLLIDLLTAAEERIDRVTSELRFDIAPLAGRLVTVTRASRGWNETAALRLGYFGASTGAAAAIVAATQAPGDVAAIVSRGGRPDLAGDALEALDVPTLFIVGGDDTIIVRLHRETLPRIHAHTELSTIPHATHLFEEPGALDEVARRASAWFSQHLVAHEGAAVRSHERSSQA
jgi:putative phosphoribosyl transferase